MRQAIPTRIPGANIIRQTPARRADGSAVLVRRADTSSLNCSLSYEETVAADFAFTTEPSFSRAPIARAMRCLVGEVFVVLVDVRRDSPSFGHWQSFCLSAGDARTLTVPCGVACGWQVLTTSASLEIRSSRDIVGRRWRWLRWNDRELAIEWPEKPSRMAKHLRRSRSLRAFLPERLPCLAQPNRQRKARTTAVPLPARQREKIATAGSIQVLQNSPLQIAGTPTINHRILIIGSSGQLGRDLCRELRSVGTVVGACRTRDKESVLPIPVFVDVSRPASLRLAIRQVKPTLIVNAASLTDLDKAETEPRLAQLVNATAPAIIADEAKRIGAAVVHFCSSMVFGGAGNKPWRECDRTAPQNQYARSKLIGTHAICQSDIPHLVLRSGWLYSSHGDNYVRRLIDSLSYRNSISLASDHIGAPTSTAWLAQTLAEILKQGQAAARSNQSSLGEWLLTNGGLYHAATLGCASKLEVGDQILATCRQHALPIVLQQLHGRPLAELPSIATIPANCLLDPTRLAMKFGLQIPRWQAELNQQIDNMVGEHRLALSNVA